MRLSDREDLALRKFAWRDGRDGRGNITSGCDIGRKAVFGFFAKRPVSGKQMAAESSEALARRANTKDMSFPGCCFSFPRCPPCLHHFVDDSFHKCDTFQPLSFLSLPSFQFLASEIAHSFIGASHSHRPFCRRQYPTTLCHHPHTPNRRLSK